MTTNTNTTPSVNDLIAQNYTGDVDGLEEKVFEKIPENTSENISEKNSEKISEKISEPVFDEKNSETTPNFLLKNDDGNKKMTKEEAEEYKQMEKTWNESLAYIKDMISPSMMKIDAKKLQIGDTLVRTIYTYAYPDVLEGNWLSPLINWDVKFDISLFVYPVDSGRVMRFLKTRLTQIRSQMLINSEK